MAKSKSPQPPAPPTTNIQIVCQAKRQSSLMTQTRGGGKFGPCPERCELNIRERSIL